MTIKPPTHTARIRGAHARAYKQAHARARTHTMQTYVRECKHSNRRAGKIYSFAHWQATLSAQRGALRVL